MALPGPIQALLEKAVRKEALSGTELQQIKDGGHEQEFLAQIQDATVRENLRKGGLM